MLVRMMSSTNSTRSIQGKPCMYVYEDQVIMRNYMYVRISIIINFFKNYSVGDFEAGLHSK